MSVLKNTQFQPVEPKFPWNPKKPLRVPLRDAEMEPFLDEFKEQIQIDPSKSVRIHSTAFLKSKIPMRQWKKLSTKDRNRLKNKLIHLYQKHYPTPPPQSENHIQIGDWVRYKFSFYRVGKIQKTTTTIKRIEILDNQYVYFGSTVPTNNITKIDPPICSDSTEFKKQIVFANHMHEDYTVPSVIRLANTLVDHGHLQHELYIAANITFKGQNTLIDTVIKVPPNLNLVQFENCTFRNPLNIISKTVFKSCRFNLMSHTIYIKKHLGTRFEGCRFESQLDQNGAPYIIVDRANCFFNNIGLQKNIFLFKGGPYVFGMGDSRIYFKDAWDGDYNSPSPLLIVSDTAKIVLGQEAISTIYSNIGAIDPTFNTRVIVSQSGTGIISNEDGNEPKYNGRAIFDYDPSDPISPADEPEIQDMGQLSVEEAIEMRRKAAEDRGDGSFMDLVSPPASPAARSPPASPAARSPPASPAARSPPASPDTLCKICQNNECDVVLKPCNHFCMCHQCAKHAKTCPMCKEPIQRRIRVQVESSSDSGESSDEGGVVFDDDGAHCRDCGLRWDGNAQHMCDIPQRLIHIDSSTVSKVVSVISEIAQYYDRIDNSIEFEASDRTFQKIERKLKENNIELEELEDECDEYKAKLLERACPECDESSSELGEHGLCPDCEEDHSCKTCGEYVSDSETDSWRRRRFLENIQCRRCHHADKTCDGCGKVVSNARDLIDKGEGEKLCETCSRAKHPEDWKSSKK